MQVQGRIRMRILVLVCVALTATLVVGLAQGPQQALPSRPTPPTPATIRASIDVSKTGESINPLMYGHFIENLRNWFEMGMWAEMIGDRKFFYPVNNNPVQDPPNGRRNLYARWVPIGPEDKVVMDRTHAYSGEHAPKILTDPTTPHGIGQALLALRSSLTYTGRIVLAGDPGARVSVTLIWGKEPQDRQTIAIPALTAQYKTYPLRFSPKLDSRDGRIEITGKGGTAFWVAAVSLMRSDNLEGWNPEFIAKVKEMRPTLLRWGGNFSADYDWRNGIGDPDKRPIRYEYAWNAIEPNDVGTVEIIKLNRLVGSEVNLGTNAGLGDAFTAAQQVEYVNGAVTTPMGKLRAQHGHPEPFKVKWWGIGNEMYGEWQIGHMYIGHYVIKHNYFAEAMRKVDPSIILVASGASRYQQSADSRNNTRLPLAIKPPFAWDSSQDWTGWLLKNSWKNMDYISEHIYGAQAQVAFDSATKTWVSNPAPLPDRLRQIANRVQEVAEDWVDYNRRMPWLKDTKIRVVLDEWHAGGGDMFVGLWTGLVMNELFRHTDVYTMSAYTCAPCALNYNKFDPPVHTSGGLVFKVLANRFGTIPVLGIQGNSPQPELLGTVGVDKPLVSSGSPTYPLDVMAALSQDKKTLTVAVVNPSEVAKELVMALVGGAIVDGSGKKWTIAGPSIDARNTAGQPQVIKLVESATTDPSAATTVPPFSISMYEWKLK